MPDELAPLRIANEYAAVSLSKTVDHGEDHLVISSPRLDHTINLDAEDLYNLLHQDKDLFSQLLSSPYGPLDPDQAYREEL